MAYQYDSTVGRTLLQYLHGCAKVGGVLWFVTDNTNGIPTNEGVSMWELLFFARLPPEDVLVNPLVQFTEFVFGMKIHVSSELPILVVAKTVKPYFTDDVQDAYDDLSLLPTDLDKIRLDQMEPDGRVEAENGYWVAFRYPTSPEKAKDCRWCEFSLIVNHPQLAPISHTFEFKNLRALMSYLEQLEMARKRASK